MVVPDYTFGTAVSESQVRTLDYQQRSVPWLDTKGRRMASATGDQGSMLTGWVEDGRAELGEMPAGVDGTWIGDVSQFEELGQLARGIGTIT